jgi:hypothetical protein
MDMGFKEMLDFVRQWFERLYRVCKLEKLDRDPLHGRCATHEAQASKEPRHWAMNKWGQIIILIHCQYEFDAQQKHYRRRVCGHRHANGRAN